MDNISYTLRQMDRFRKLKTRYETYYRTEEKIQGRGMSRSNASYGIQQLLQEQASVHYDLLIST